MIRMPPVIERNDADSPAIATSAVVTREPAVGQTWIVDSLHYSFDSTPVNGIGIVAFGPLGTVFKVYIPRAGRYGFRIPRGLYASANRNGAMSATLSGGGLNATGAMNETYR